MRRLRSSSIKSRGAAFLVLLICLFSSAAFGQPWDGNGVEGDPYLIYDACDMQAIGADANFWDAHFILMADIDLSNYTGASFNRIGLSNNNSFRGLFDGNGHTISNFSYTSTGTDYKGVFGYVRGEIKDLGLINPNVDAGTGNYVGSLVGCLHVGSITNCYAEGGSVSARHAVGGLVGANYSGEVLSCWAVVSVSGTLSYAGGLVGFSSSEIVECYAGGSVSGWRFVGGLVGYQSGVMSRCFATSSVSGTSMHVGGLAGKISYGGTVSDCYASGSVSGQDRYVGGLVGMCQEPGSLISNCYSVGPVSGPWQFGSVGGLVGDTINGGLVTGSFWNIETSGQASSDGGVGKTTHEMERQSTFADAGWDFVGESSNGTEDIWKMSDGHDYPRLSWESLAYGGGSGTAWDPYRIYQGDHMQSIGATWSDWDKHFRLMADIDLSAYTGTSFNIIGNYTMAFTGIFEGNRHTISNFSYTSISSNHIGIFGYVAGSDVEIRDLLLVSPNVDAGMGDSVGVLVGKLLDGTVSGCYVRSGSVTGYGGVGGIVGANYGTVVECSAAGVTVSGSFYIGGLVGHNYGAVRRSLASGNISGEGGTGGLVGLNGDVMGHWSGLIENSCAGGVVTGTIGNVGGLLGANIESSNVEKCYSTSVVLGSVNVGGLVGDNIASTVIDSFWDVNSSGRASSAGGLGLPTAEMQTESTFTDAGWDFTTPIWEMNCEGMSYPKLSWWQPVLGDFNCPDGVDVYDLMVLCEEWLFQELSADVWPEGGDGFVNFFDWAIFADGWQTTHDIFDLAEFADQWLKTGANYLIADIAPAPGGDGIVNILDFAALAENWLAGM